MRRLSFIPPILILALLPAFSSCNSSSETATVTELHNQTEKISYTIGTDLANYEKQIGIEIDTAALVQGMLDHRTDGPTLLTAEQLAEVKTEMGRAMRSEKARKRQDLSEKNRIEGETFLAENKNKPGVITTASGLQYKILQKGDGPVPTNTDRVKVHYRGKLLDGTEFDSSYERGTPATFAVTGVINGWTEALQLMKVGSKYELYIPSELAYGENGSGPRIGPDSVLIFEVELLSIGE